MVFTAFWSKLEKIMYATRFENVLLCNWFKLWDLAALALQTFIRYTKSNFS